ncbi:MAG: hypothetical protein ACREUQ_15810 [Burkholderiales bacterium]
MQHRILKAPRTRQPLTPIDFTRYVLQEPPVPTRWRRRMLSLGSGEPTRAMCSTLIAQAFQSIRFRNLRWADQIALADATSHTGTTDLAPSRN